MATTCKLEFTVVVQDTDQWDLDLVEAADEDEDTEMYDQWATARLEEVMRAAADEFITNNPTLFRGGLT